MHKRIQGQSVHHIHHVSPPEVSIDPIDTINMNFVQNLITAINESDLDSGTKSNLRVTLDRWQNALMLTPELHVILP